MSRRSLLFIALVAAAIAIALFERIYSLRNERRILREGGREVAAPVYRTMLPVYSALFPLCVIEHLALRREPPAAWMASMIILFLAAKGLKLWAVLQLGRNWTMRVLIPADLRIVSSGPYRFIRHPNYVAVLGEVVALPLAGMAWLTGLAGGAAFLALLRWRVRREEAALFEHPDYAGAMGSKRRFLPGRSGGKPRDRSRRAATVGRRDPL
jgi:methyltransferase